LALLIGRRKEFERRVLRLVLASIIFSIGSELAFTLYISVFGLANLIGHYFKIISFYLMYRAIIETGLREPYGLLFRELEGEKAALRESEEALRKAHDELEFRVQERTAELETAKKAMATERQKLYDILETMPVLVCLLTPDHHVVFANRSFREKFGEDNGRRCFEYCFDRKEPCDFCETFNTLGTGEPHQWEFAVPDGSIIDMHTFPFVDTDGSLLVLEMGIDITKRKRAEHELKQTLADLLRSNDDLEQFAYVASHDLQEPLRTVTGAVQMLAKDNKGRLDAHSEQLISYAVDYAGRMKALITDLLTYSRLSTRGRPFATVDVQEVLGQSISNLDGLVAEKGAEITYGPMPVIRADATQLAQVFQNLINNAIKFGPDRAPKVRVSAKRDSSEWIFSVEDNGIGIDRVYFDRIFVIFQQLNKKGPFHGTGMGLAIVKKIVERHRGRLWVESKIGAGSTFYFTIPEG
jgi:PAS domain S-box-containing protein